jgi:hypothetical protein
MKLFIIIFLTLTSLLAYSQNESYEIVYHGALGEGNQFFFCGGVMRPVVEIQSLKKRGRKLKVKGRYTDERNIQYFVFRLLVGKTTVDENGIIISKDIKVPILNEVPNIFQRRKAEKRWNGEFKVKVKLAPDESLFIESIGYQTIEIRMK